ncbi:MAG: hypothetical protein K6D97_05155 [Clostridia bacterium]|nr:hypothetical protein [Clostridia bacterium]
MDKDTNIEELRKIEAEVWKEEEERRAARAASDQAVINAYMMASEDDAPVDPKGRTKPHRSRKKKPVYYHTEGSEVKIANPARVADKTISEYCGEEPEDPDEIIDSDAPEDSERKSADPNKKKKKGKDREWQWGPDFRKPKPSRKAEKAIARQNAAERREARAQKGKDNAAKSAQRKADQAKIAAAHEEAITSHEPAKYTGVAVVDATARTRGKRTAGRRIPGKSRKSC